jgi:hypothetical protein
VNLEGIGIEPCGGRPLQHRVHASWTTDTFGPTIKEAEEYVETATKDRTLRGREAA